MLNMPDPSFRQGSLLQDYFLLEHYTAVCSGLFRLFLTVITRNPVLLFQGWMQRLFCHETLWDLYCFQFQLGRTQVFKPDLRIWVSSFVRNKFLIFLKNTNCYKIGERKKEKIMTFTIFCLLLNSLCSNSELVKNSIKRKHEWHKKNIV